jgi:hypothetical protein
VGFQKTPPRRIRIAFARGDDAASSPNLCEDAPGRLKHSRRRTFRWSRELRDGIG